MTKIIPERTTLAIGVSYASSGSDWTGQKTIDGKRTVSSGQDLYYETDLELQSLKSQHTEFKSVLAWINAYTFICIYEGKRQVGGETHIIRTEMVMYVNSYNGVYFQDYVTSEQKPTTPGGRTGIA